MTLKPICRKIGMPLLVAAALLSLPGCGSVGGTERKLTLAQVVQAVRAQGIELNAAGTPGQETAAAGVLPTSFLVSRSGDPSENAELLHVYVFRSSAERERGAEAFRHLYETAKIAFAPNELAVHNVLLVYWSRSPTDARFLKPMREAVSGLEQP